jgi:hypothetical protein
MDPYRIVNRLHDIGLTDAAIARIVCCGSQTIWRIRHGEESGRNIAPYLRNLAVAVKACEQGYSVEYGDRVRRG